MKNVLVTITTAFWILPALLIFMLRPSYADSPNGLCLTEPEFTDVNAMGQTDEQRLQAIRDWLDGRLPRSPSGGFLKGTKTNPDGSIAPFTFTDLDGKPTDPAEQISNAAKANKINPRVLLTTLRKEKPELFRDSSPPSNKTLSTLAGCGSSPSARQQIQCMGQKLKEWFYDQLSQCKATPGGWNVDVEKETGDTEKKIFETNQDGVQCHATPESKAATALYQYTPWKGRYYDDCGWGHRDYPGGVGGNGLFCRFWRQHGWEAPPGPLTLSPQAPTLSCAPNTSRCVSINVSGGDVTTSPYTWKNSKGLITKTGVNQQNIQIRPPANPGATIQGLAYENYVWFRVLKQGGVNSFRTKQWSCDDQEIQACFGSTHNGCSPTTAGHIMGPCRNAPDPNSQVTMQSCPPPNNVVPEVRINFLDETSCQLPGYFCDRRSQSMVNSNCRPCGVEMQGGITLTVTDSAGVSASTTVGGQ